MDHYLLMNQDSRVLRFSLEQSAFGESIVKPLERYADYLPYGYTSIADWLESRPSARHRRQMAELMHFCGCADPAGFIAKTHCASLNDTFWVKREDDDFQWRDVSLYRNAFDEGVARLAFDGAGPCGPSFSPATPELTTGGSFDKCWVRRGGRIFLLKRGSGKTAAGGGMEPYGEALAAQLADALGAEHVSYALTQYHGQLASQCPIFTTERVGFVSVASLAGRHITIGKAMELFASVGSQEAFRRMLIFDALCANVDRHMGNYGFLVDNQTGRLLGMAPLFDHNLAFLPHLMEEDSHLREDSPVMGEASHLTRDDSLELYLQKQAPRIGDDFVQVARAVLTPALRAELIRFGDFSLTDPGFGYPAWRLECSNRLVQLMRRRILES